MNGDDEVNVTDVQSVLARLQAQACAEAIDFTLHAQQEMAEEAISPEDVLHAIATAQVLENYPAHQRGACCLLSGQSGQGRPLHIVCTTAQATLILITVYEPVPPKWTTPTQRRAS
jgi:hypothetical protein